MTDEDPTSIRIEVAKTVYLSDIPPKVSGNREMHTLTMKFEHRAGCIDFIVHLNKFESINLIHKLKHTISELYQLSDFEN